MRPLFLAMLRLAVWAARMQPLQLSDSLFP